MSELTESRDKLIADLKAVSEEHGNARRVLEQTVADRLPRWREGLARLVSALAAQGIGFTTIDMKQSTLEDIFVRLTGEGAE